jgi:hypothetical protein
MLTFRPSTSPSHSDSRRSAKQGHFGYVSWRKRFLISLTRRASLNKLAIRGIRSFDDKHVQVIEFYSPLTVIVGHNGSGKTVRVKWKRVKIWKLIWRLSSSALTT